MAKAKTAMIGKVETIETPVVVKPVIKQKAEVDNMEKSMKELGYTKSIHHDGVFYLKNASIITKHRYSENEVKELFKQ